jgi:hypothetical protein
LLFVDLILAPLHLERGRRTQTGAFFSVHLNRTQITRILTDFKNPRNPCHLRSILRYLTHRDKQFSHSLIYSIVRLHNFVIVTVVNLMPIKIIRITKVAIIFERGAYGKKRLFFFDKQLQTLHTVDAPLYVFQNSLPQNSQIVRLIYEQMKIFLLVAHLVVIEVYGHFVSFI